MWELDTGEGSIGRNRKQHEADQDFVTVSSVVCTHYQILMLSNEEV